ncbi:LysR substrate-binding domain-containing protein [Rhodoligotrophos defluvii]|uniref:LysR substrate-binding domain-containing protein n=1 Tax=Rhodoligotrophos defluvii TaxID=2561934 RepID=UPI0010C9C161|nr:LysR substrate-binding domain-containing protein [Rhodoligotrophos defluvii]
MRNVADLEANLIDFSSGIRGHVRIWANESTLFGFIPERLESFTEAYPQVRIELQSNLSPFNVQAVRDNSADIGIFSGNLPTADLTVETCFEDKLMVIVPRGHPLEKSSVVRFADILRYEFVEQEPRSSIQTLLFRQASEQGSVMKSRVRVGGFDAVCRMVESRLGIGVIPSLLAERLAPVMDIAVIPLAESWATRIHKICVRAQDDLPVATRLLLRHLTSEPSPSSTTLPAC